VTRRLGTPVLRPSGQREAEPGQLRREVAFVGLALLVCAVLLLARLDDIYLWQDEAETALVSRHWLGYGLPLSTDGTDWVQQSSQSFVEFTPDVVWIYHSWLQYALTAVSFSALGLNTFAARLPFVLVGLATVAFFYRFVLRWIEDLPVARVATALLVFCVPFLLLMRQCRYYALAAFFTLVTLDAYLQLRAGKPWALPYFVASSTLLYHSHYGAFFPTLAAIGIHWLFSQKPNGLTRRFLVAAVLTAVLVLPWAGFMRVWGRGEPFRLDRFLAHLGQHAVYITSWVFPLALIAVLVLAWLRWRSTGRGHRNTWPAMSAAQAQFCELAGLVIVVNIVIVSASAAFDWVFFRYIVHLIPLLLTMLSIALVLLWRRWPLVAAVLLVTVLSSNALALVPYGLPGFRALRVDALWPSSVAFQSLQEVWAKAGHFRSDPLMYYQELTHAYAGPNEGLVGFLATNAQPGQTVAVNYEDLPLMFYTSQKILGGLGLHGLDKDSQPDWIVDRQYGPYRDLLAALVGRGSYERIEIPYADIRWENRPEPGEHHYLTVADEDPVVVYKRLGG
jgi:4-amino-4-deoxy-L-arabinose transferase-like glycosyltransferase